MIDRSFHERRRPRAIAVAAPDRGAAWPLLVTVLLALACSALVALARADDGPTTEPFPIVVHEPARLVSRWPVTWPQAARDAGVGGTVIVAARVGRDGRLRETQVVGSIPELDEAAVFAARRYLFMPAKDEKGAEIESWVLLPLRFDASVPIGSHGADPIPAHLYSDVERSFESDVETLAPDPIAAPNSATLDQHRQIMADANLLDVIPPPSENAIRAFLRGDTLANSTATDKRETSRAAWAEAAHLAPWWPLPYRRMATAAIADRDYDAAAACANVILAGRPTDEEALAILKRAGQLKQAPPPKKKSK